MMKDRLMMSRWVIVIALITAATAGAQVDFATQVWPVIEARCISCHGPEKDRGELRLDSAAAILEGGELGDDVVPGNAAGSYLVELIELPADHDDVMPAKGDPLAPDQIALIRQWIDEGANFGEWEAMPEPAPSEGEDLLAKLAESVEPAPTEAIEAVAATGATIMPLAQNSPLLRVDLQRAQDGGTDAQLALLAPLADQVTWLNLAGTKVTDAGLAHVAGLKHLTILHLERTALTDAGLAHVANFENLRYLNLYGTKVTDAGLPQLASLGRLNKLYLWQSQATEDGAAKLREALPDVQINLGSELTIVEEKRVTFNTAQLALLFTAGCCCESAKNEGKECDHPCCIEARGQETVCTKCNAEAPPLLNLIAQFTPDCCCDKAFKEGAWCDHECCVEARAQNTVCKKCNADAA